MKNIKQTVTLAILFVSLIGNIFGVIYIKHLKQSNKLSDYIETDIEESNITDTLSDWEVFTLALMKVESEYNNNAVSSAGAKGYFQITPIYVKEVNRIHKTDYTFDQVTDFNKAYEIFDLMQKAHNPDYNMDKALELHNGKHKWYNRRVYNEMSNIQKYEEMRAMLKSI